MNINNIYLEDGLVKRLYFTLAIFFLFLSLVSFESAGQTPINLTHDSKDKGAQDYKRVVQYLRNTALYSDMEYATEALQYLYLINLRILERYPTITEKLFFQSHESVGKSLYRLKNDIDLVVSVLIEESWLGNIESQKMLNSIFFKKRISLQSKKKIKEYYLQSANEGFKNSSYALGQIYLYGVDVNIDLEKSKKCFIQANLSEGYNKLGLYFLHQLNDIETAQYYFDAAFNTHVR